MAVGILLLALVLLLIGWASYAISPGVHKRLVKAGNPRLVGYKLRINYSQIEDSGYSCFAALGSCLLRARQAMLINWKRTAGKRIRQIRWN